MDIFNRKLEKIFAKHNFDYKNSETVPKEIFEEVQSTMLDMIMNYKKNLKVMDNTLNISNREIKDYIRNLEEAKAQLAMSSKMAGIGEMASSISHEINNSLAVISLNFQQVKFILKKMNVEDPLINDCLEQTKKSINRVSHIISGIKRISLKNEENLSLHKVDSIKIINETISFCMGDINRSNIKFTNKLPHTEKFVLVDEVYFSQVVLNLLTNAKQAISHLEEKTIDISFNEESDCYSFIFTNSGPKIPEDIQEKIFQSFFTTKKVGEGTGLGLNISRKLMNGFNGSLELNKEFSTPQFIVKLPKVIDPT